VAVHLHHAPRTDQLADALGELLSVPLADAFANEVVVVPAKGVERWLAQRLSHRLGVGGRGGDGVCAGVQFVSPRSLVSLLLERGVDDVWDADRMVWPLLRVIDSSLDEPRLAALARHLGHGLDTAEAALRHNRRWSVARRLAGLFASYAAQRPALLTDWRLGHDTDGAGGELDADLAWQPELWRRLLAEVGEPAPDERHAAVVGALRDGSTAVDLPERLSLFGHTRISATEVELLAALGEHRDVHLYLPQPSPALWDALSARPAAPVVPRADDDSAELVRHPLLASLGRDARELHRTLRGFPSGEALPVAPEPATLLGWLQADLRSNDAPSPAERAGRVVAEGDRSVQVHATHGPSRQVEVLREVLVGLLQDDPTLEPRDVLVMCPDIETYAPLVAAGFGLADLDQEATHPAHRLRVRMADRALSSTNPLLRTALALVLLAGGRVSAPEVLDLAGSEPVRRRFRFTDDDLARIDRWVADAGIRWGLDADHRAPFGMSRFGHNTWRMGLDRLLLGIAMSGDGYHALGRGLPVDDVGSSDIDLVGRFAELVDIVTRAIAAFEAAATVDDWTTALRAAVAGLTAVDRDSAWQVPQFEGELARATASAASSEVPLRLADVRALLESRLGGRPTRANFRTGTLTVSTMVPMRSVPHRVVCLVGLDDVFPRSPHVDGDDVLMRRPLTGERDPRSEDRQLLLDAVLAATETLVITYTGAHEQSGAERPPSVPLGELIDALDRTASGPDGTAVRDHLLRRHPLQPYDPRNFTDGLAVGQRAPLSFDATALSGAESAAGERRPARPLLPGPLPPASAGDVTLEELKDFLRHPVRTFLKTRLNVTSPLESREVADEIPVQLDGLERWAIGDRFVRELMAGLDVEAVIAAEQLRGSLPPGPLGSEVLREIADSARELLRATADLRAGEPRSFDVTIDLGGGRQVTGTVGPVYGNQLVSVGYSRLKPAHRLNAWVDLLALSVALPDQNWTAHTVGKHSSGAQRALAGPLDHRALDWLRDLVALRDEGLCQPLPLPVETAAAWAGSRTDPQADADKRWRTDRFGGGIPGEDADPYHGRVFGSNAPLSVLIDAGLPRLAHRLWGPLVEGAEKVGKL